MDFLKSSKSALKKAAKKIEEGKVVVFPTDTIYGFLADAENKKAVEKIFKIKKRSRSKPLPVFIKDIKMAKELAEISPTQEKILKKYWPGPYTFILKVKPEARSTKSETNSNFKFQISNFVMKNGKIALRLPKHKLLLKLLSKVNRPLAQTSVNISDEPSMNKIKEIEKAFGDNSDISCIFDGGNLPKTKPSVIMDLTKTNIKILRK